MTLKCYIGQINHNHIHNGNVMRNTLQKIEMKNGIYYHDMPQTNN